MTDEYVREFIIQAEIQFTPIIDDEDAIGPRLKFADWCEANHWQEMADFQRWLCSTRRRSRVPSIYYQEEVVMRFWNIFGQHETILPPEITRHLPCGPHGSPCVWQSIWFAEVAASIAWAKATRKSKWWQIFRKPWKPDYSPITKRENQ